MMDWGDNGGWAWWWMIPMMMFMIVLVGAVVWALVAFARSSGGTPPRSATAPSPEDILGERFARGEIDAAEYRERIDALHGQNAVAKR
jgi:putative membrane protein